ncbi:MAG: ChaB family protein [Acidimicrobiia bacterium]|nr:ChaB family protein [Acidimicrobiia bacterium]
MPYDSINDLPESVKDSVPQHAQEIYKEAFNSAWQQYDEDESRAHATAWSAVKNDYEKGADGTWHKK